MRTAPIFILILLLSIFTNGIQAQGLVVNEISNGPAGTQEFVELVVVGPTLTPNCGPIDLRGWILDDNNGDFSCGSCAGTGIATGHQRFANLAVWSAVPTGSIIVIYDPITKNPRVPADDPNDTAPADGVYILSSSHASLEVSTTPCGAGNMPTGAGACGSCTGLPTYAGACYTAGLANATWGLRNSGDAAQVRTPSGAYFHGIGYGTAASLINGGPDGLMVSPLDGTGRYFAFVNSASNNFRAVSNFAVALVSSLGETPGAANSVNNAAWLATLTTPCVLPVNYYRELSVKTAQGLNLLEWTTASENNADHWDVLRAASLEDAFLSIGQVAATGNSNSLQEYTFADPNPEQPTVWYQLRQVDQNGNTEYSRTIEVTNGSVAATFLEIWPNPSTGIFQLRGALQGLQRLQVIDMMGRVCYETGMQQDVPYFEMQLDLGDMPQGNYWVQLRTATKPLVRMVTVQHGR
jgi:hypothetical protein